MDKIRITSGKFKGRSIDSPKSNKTHPMGSREKIALFNMISDYLPDAEVLDAFAGSGALGIEAFSRGAKYVDYIEKDLGVAQILIKNLASLGIGSAEINIMDANKFKLNKSYDVIIADPPYDKFDIKPIIHLTKFLKNGGVFVLSHPDETPVIPDLDLTKTRKYAKAHISIYQKSA